MAMAFNFIVGFRTFIDARTVDEAAEFPLARVAADLCSLKSTLDGFLVVMRNHVMYLNPDNY